ncbi:acyl-CoA dehydrogenase family protein [Bacillaceae bacterium W0354]
MVTLNIKEERLNFFKEDKNLQYILKGSLSEGFYSWADGVLNRYGELCANELGRRAVHTDREGEPRLIRYDKMGNEVSEVWLNEGYKESVEDTYNTGIVGYIHKEIPELGHKGNYVYAYGLTYLLSMAEPGLACPVTLTKATAYLIDHYASSELKERFLPHVLSTGEVELYEGATFLTERQGGSDVGANVVEAVQDGDCYRITGEKYFASNAGACGVAMVLARLKGAPDGTRGLSLFLVPWEENRRDGRLRIRRLKDKLGVRAVPSAEVEFEGARAYLVGEENHGFYYMIEALNLSRVSNAVASLGIMRRAYLEAKSYAEGRITFGQKLTAFSMVRATLSQMVAKQEVEMRAVFEVIEMMDRVMGLESKHLVTERERALFRLYVAMMKMETADQAVHFAHEAIEMHGGNGYIEDFVTPRLLRDAQVLTVWEGTANILGLEVLRLLKKFNIDSVYTEEMLKRLGRVEAKSGVKDELSEWVQKVKGELSKLIERTNKIKLLSYDLQTHYCKDLTKWMVDIFESVVAIELAVNGDVRQKAIAEIFLETLWKHDEVLVEPAELKRFEAVVLS